MGKLQIGNVRFRNRLMMAPLAGITNAPFRLMAKKKGAGLVWTEMISAKGLVLNQAKTHSYLNMHPDEGPVVVQIFGSVADVMACAAEIAVEGGASIVDINMGCPARKVLKTGAGGALLRDRQKVKEIVSAVRRSCTAPVTVKLRAGWSPNEPLDDNVIPLIEDCGADALTLHPRMVTEGFAGKADWSAIRVAKERVKIPVIGNGDVFDPALALSMRRQTGCDGVMIGRGAVGNPWIFQQILDMEQGVPLREPSLGERRAVIMEHFGLLCDLMGESGAARNMRGLLLWYTKGLPNSTAFRGVINRIHDLGTLVSTLDAYLFHLEDGKRESAAG
jgi:nifR3 family TIM-barrel protein